MDFWTSRNIPIPAITAAQMVEIDRIAVEGFGLGLLQMMENAGRNLAGNVLEMLSAVPGTVVVLAGTGGNGGGGLCCARHLLNRGLDIAVILDREVDQLRGAALNQWRVLQAAGVKPLEWWQAQEAVEQATIVVDALIGYSLAGPPRGKAAELIALCNQYASTVLSLDVPSGVDATTGEMAGAAVRADRTLTLAAPKTGLAGVSGAVYLADIGIPPAVFARLGTAFAPPFGTDYWIELFDKPIEEKVDG